MLRLKLVSFLEDSGVVFHFKCRRSLEVRLEMVRGSAAQLPVVNPYNTAMF